MPNDIRTFFNNYRDAFNRLDGRGVSDHYQTPSMISSSSGEGLFSTDAALLTNNVALCEHYRQAGFVRADYAVNHDLAQGNDFYFADLRWTIFKQDALNESHESFNTSYQLTKRSGAWKIEHVTAYSEKQPSAALPS
jgi:hypothetical protein